MWLRPCAALALAALTAPGVRAEEPPPQPGERVRLKMPKTQEVHGRLVEIGDDALVVDAEEREESWLDALHGNVLVGPGRLRVPLSSVTRLEVVRGKRSNWLVAVGAGAGAGGLAYVIGAFSYGTVAACGNDESCPSESSVAGVAVGAAVATTLAVGLFARSDRWVDVTPAKARVAIAPLPGHGVAVALSLRF